MIKRMDEEWVDLIVRDYLKHATEGDLEHARRLHRLFNWMLNEQINEGSGETWWLTPFAKSVLAEQHEALACCEGTTVDDLANPVLHSVLLHPPHGNIRTDTDNARDLRITWNVIDELVKQHHNGVKLNKTAACKIVGKQYELETGTVLNIYKRMDGNGLLKLKLPQDPPNTHK